MVSALTLLALDEALAAYASDEDLAEIVRHRFDSPAVTLRELFGRLVFKVLSGNTDDHARNHAALWDGARLKLAPAYDICPQTRVGQEATRATKILGDKRQSRLELCVEAASRFLLSPDDARSIVDAQRESIRVNWSAVCDQANLGEAQRDALWGRQFLNPYALQGYA